MQTADLLRKLGGEHDRLAETADPVSGPVPREIAPPNPIGLRVTGEQPCGPPGPNAAPGLVVKILREIANGRRYLAMNRMDRAVRWMPQRDNPNVETALLQREDLLRTLRDRAVPGHADTL